VNWEVGGLALAALLWATWIARLLSLFRGSGDRAQWRECGSFLTAAICLTLQLPTVAATVDRLAGVFDLARLFGNVAGVVAAWLFYPCMLRLWMPTAHGRDVLASGWLMLGVNTALFGIFILFPARANTSPPQYPPSPFTIYHQSLAYSLVYLGYLGAIVFRMLVLTLREGSHVARARATPRRLRHQLGAQALGWAAGVGFAIHESLHALLRQLGMAYPLGDPAVVSNGLLIVAVLGVTGGDLGTPRRWLAQYRSYRRLYPLWHLLRTTTPPIALTALFSPPRSATGDAARLGRITLRRLRRVVEIRDGMLALRPFCDPQTATKASELCQRSNSDVAKRQAIVEAAMLVVASRTYVLTAHNIQAATQTPAPDFVSPANFEDEVAHLERVSDAVAYSPIVAEVVAVWYSARRLDDAA
jgi:hypothetical protein